MPTHFKADRSVTTNKLPANITLELAAENALLIRFASQMEAGLPSQIQHACRAIETTLQDDLLDLVPSYTTLLVVFSRALPLAQAKPLIENALFSIKTNSTNTLGKHHILPICYQPPFALDLDTLANTLNLSPADIIAIHSATPYQVGAVGFSPAFAYLGVLDARICHPRHASPRANIPAGSLGIADNQTAVYPTASPAGWQIIGQTPLDLSLAQPENLTRFSVGDRVQFVSIDKAQFEKINALTSAQQSAWLLAEYGEQSMAKPHEL